MRDCRARLTLAFLLLLAIMLLATRSSLSAPFIGDDLHLVRIHTPQELARAWTDTYDSDHKESYGFRLLTVYFEHFRALVFGESVVRHRLFLLVLFCIYLTLAGLLARALFGITFWPLLIGLLLAFFHTSNVLHYIWIEDGIFLLSGIFTLAAILSLFGALGSGHARWLVASLLCSALALLTRDDSLIVYPLLLWCGVAFGKMRDEARPTLLRKLPLAIYAGLMAMALASYWYWRSVAVPQAPALSLNLGGYVWALTRIVQNAGQSQDLIRPWPTYELLIWSWRVWICSLVLIGLLAVKRPYHKPVLILAGGIFLSALPNLQLARADLLLLPVTFWGLLIAMVLVASWRTSTSRPVRLLVIVMTLFALAVPAYGSQVFMQDLRVNNLTVMCYN